MTPKSPVDPLSLTRGIVLTDAALARYGLSRGERIDTWEATLRGLPDRSTDLGVGRWLIPGVRMQTRDTSGKVVYAEMGWPKTAAERLGVPLRRFGSWSWDLDGGTWGYTWTRDAEELDPAGWPHHEPWDDVEDSRLVHEGLRAQLTKAFLRNEWERAGWKHAAPDWAYHTFQRNHAVIENALLAALEIDPRIPMAFTPVLSGGEKLETATVRNLQDPKTTLYVPDEGGFFRFLRDVKRQSVLKHTAMSMAFSWWARQLDEVVP